MSVYSSCSKELLPVYSSCLKNWYSFSGTLLKKGVHLNFAVDFGVSAQLDKTIGRRNTFIGTPYWFVFSLNNFLYFFYLQPFQIGLYLNFFILFYIVF